MPEKKTIERARKGAREGEGTLYAGWRIRAEEIEHIRQGKHGARSVKQAIAIGLSKARRAASRTALSRQAQKTSHTLSGR